MTNFGLIPACAGKTGPPSIAVELARAHPRVCGENCMVSRFIWYLHGSSPRVRGKLIPRGEGTLSWGLIPACAGKTSRPAGGGGPNWAHPRVCGENLGAPPPMPPKVGSSPRVRGKQPRLFVRRCQHGLIPACAGKTFGQIVPQLVSRAHPRVCGENQGKARERDPLLGSSPRVRGKPKSFCKRSVLIGLIPACAGKTLNDLEF